MSASGRQAAAAFAADGSKGVIVWDPVTGAPLAELSLGSDDGWGFLGDQAPAAVQCAGDVVVAAGADGAVALFSAASP